MDNLEQDWTIKKFKEMLLPEKNSATSNIIREGDSLLGIYSGCAERLIKSLFLMNSGGVVTVLTYLNSLGGSSEHVKKWILLSFVLFLMGLVCAFILVAYDYLSFNCIYLTFKKESRKFLLNEINFSDITHFQLLKQRLVRKWLYNSLIYGVGSISFFCAIVGIGAGICGYFLNVS